MTYYNTPNKVTNFFVACIFVVLFLIVLLFLIKNSKKPKNFPKGPFFLPIFGSLYTLPGRGAHLQIAKWRQKYGNIIGHKFGSSFEIYITGLEESLAALKHPNFQGRKIFQHRNNGLKRGLFFNDGPRWAKLKKFTLNHFNEYQKVKIENLMADELKDWLHTIKTDGTKVEINYKTFSFVLNILMKIISSTTSNEHFDKILSHCYHSLHDNRPTGIENYFPIIRKKFFRKDLTILFVRKFLRECLEQHRATLKEDHCRDYMDAFLIQQIGKNQEDKDDLFNDEELISDCYDLIRAGSISTADTIAFIILYLLLHPDVQKKMCDEIDSNIESHTMPSLKDRKKLPYCEAVIAESMRINPIAPFTAPHRCTENTEFYGYMIPQNTVIKVSLWTLFRDPTLWHEPERFQPERFIANGEFIKYNHHLPFGLGKRSCLLETMARNIVFLFLTSFFQKFSVHSVDGPLPSTEPLQGSVTGPKPFKILIKNRK